MRDTKDVESVLVRYQPDFREAFRALNLAWLEGNNLLEPADLVVLDDPEGRVLSRGGEIFFAIAAGVPVGACAAIPAGPGVVELAKLAVDPSAQGRGLGRRLCERVIAFARERGAEKVILTSSTKLVAAVRLYESLGFVHRPMPEDVPYETADVYMELRGVRADVHSPADGA